MERQERRGRRTGMRRRSAWLPALAGVLVLVGCSHENDEASRAGSSLDAALGVEQSATPEVVDLSLDCTGNQYGAAVLDYMAPRSRAHGMRTGWARTAKDALGGMADPESRRGERLGIVSLSDGVRSVTPGGRVNVQFAALNADGETVAVFVANRVFRDVWAVGTFRECP